ncbi:Uncharacterized protein APZ42_002504, partial [Daphnia magna]
PSPWPACPWCTSRAWCWTCPRPCAKPWARRSRRHEFAPGPAGRRRPLAAALCRHGAGRPGGATAGLRQCRQRPASPGRAAGGSPDHRPDAARPLGPGPAGRAADPPRPARPGPSGRLQRRPATPGAQPASDPGRGAHAVQA